MNDYSEMQQQLARGWNTWNTRSVLSHVLLPDGLTINLGVKEYAGGGYLKEALIGRFGAGDEQITPGMRSYDGRYTELIMKWRGVELKVQSAAVNDDLVILVTPLSGQLLPALLVVEAGLLWNHDGYVKREGERLLGCLPSREVAIYATAAHFNEPYVATQGPYLALQLRQPVGISTGKPRSLDEITGIINHAREREEAYRAHFGDLAETYAAMQTCLAWNTIYDPLHDRVVSPVSRIWNMQRGGYVLFCWDTYFAALMAACDNKALAYANAVEITREIRELEFVPNVAQANNRKSRDRSQPPVGSITIRELYRQYGDNWLLEETFADLLTWNRWWYAHRRHSSGYLCWGSHPFTPVVGVESESSQPNTLPGAKFESGLDNSPMYDEIPFDRETHLMQLADVGLMSLYVADCRALAEMAEILGRVQEERELRQRGEEVAGLLQGMWNDAAGIFLNRRLDTGEFSPRLSPTNFYPLLAGVATVEQAQRMVNEHLYNPEEFWGQWVLPSIARNDPAYPDNDYWRGRIWAPMNYLVYLSLRNSGMLQACADLAEKSRDLLLKEWREHGHVHENYHADTGEGCDVRNSDKFYHWGGLLGLITLMEAKNTAEKLP